MAGLSEGSTDRVLYHIADILSLPLPVLLDKSHLSFISLGGHSLSAYALLNRCKKDGILLSIRSVLQTASVDQLVLEATQKDPKQTSPVRESARLLTPALPSRVARVPLSANRQIERQHALVPDSRRFDVSSSNVDDNKCFSITEMQSIMLWRSISQPGSNVISVFDSYKTSDIPSVIDAWRKLILSETHFRMCLTVIDGAGYIAHRPDSEPTWTERVFHESEQYQSALTRQPNDVLLTTSFEVLTLDAGLADRTSTLIWRTPHALLDGYSAQLIYSKLRAIISGSIIEPGPTTAERQILRNKSSYVRSRQFWDEQRAQFPDTVGKLSLAIYQTPQPDGSPSRVQSTHFQTSLAALLELSQGTGVSLASIYHAAWAITLSVFMNTTCVQFGAVLSGRDIDDSENVIGNLVNTLPLNVSVDPSLGAEDYLKSVHDALVNLSTISRSIAEDGFTRDFDSLLAMQFSLKMPPANVHAVPLGPPRMEIVSDVPVSVCVWPDGDVRMDWHVSRFTATSMKNITSYFDNALRLLTTHTRTVSDILADLMPSDLNAHIHSISNARDERTHPGTIHDDLVMRFERTVCDFPWITAVQKGREICSYRELDQRASQIASHLSTRVQRGDVVCVIADRSINWIVAIYGILKAGATYSPIDPSLPLEMQEANLAIAKANVLLVSGSTIEYSELGSKRSAFSIQELLDTALLEGTEIPHRKNPTPSDDAYLCFTSGSSGRPKGVRCTHEGLLAFHSSEQTRMYSMPGSRTAQLMSPAFDGSIHEIFSALGWGSTLVLADGDDLFAHLQSAHCAVMTPSIAKTLDPADFPHLRTISVVGEPLPQSVADQWSTSRMLLNMYGPSEGTCGATTAFLPPGQAVTIGRPNPTTRLYILDQHGNLCPPEVIGEIHLAGIQVARGYVGRPEETQLKFSIDPFVGGGKQMMYRTGDRAFWNSSDLVEYVVRDDRLVKLRGIRLDLGDLETRISSRIPDVTAAALTRVGDHLVAMVQPADLDITDLQFQIRNVIPHYAIPKHIICVNDFPKTPIGKIDYKAIAAMSSRMDLLNEKSALPVTPSELIVSGIWRDLLDLNTDQPISSATDFRLLGGHSLLQLAQVERLRTAFQVDVPYRLVIENQQLSAVASAIDKLVQSRQSSEANLIDMQKVLPLGRGCMSPLDKEWYHKYQLKPSSSTSFNVAYAVELDPLQVDAERLCKAWAVVLRRHEILRSRHVKDSKGNLVRRYASSPSKASLVDHVDIRDEINRTMDIENDSPVRIVISSTMMVATLSHILCDYTALHTLLRELTAAYIGTPLPPIPSTFADSIAWSKPVPQSTQNFWNQTLSRMPPPMFPTRTDFGGSSAMYKLSTSLYQGIKGLNTKYGTSLHQIAVAAVSLILSFKHRDTDVMVGAPFLNRDSKDATVVGNFVQALPIRIQHDANTSSDSDPERQSCEAFLYAVQKASQASLAHAIPTDKIISCQPECRDTISALPEDPLLEVMVTLHDESTKRKLSSLEIPGTQPLSVWAEGSKFKLMLEFWCVGDDHFAVRAEWDQSVVGDANFMQSRVMLLETAFSGFIDGMGFTDIKQRLVKVQEEIECGMTNIAVEQLHMFGTPMR